MMTIIELGSRMAAADFHTCDAMLKSSVPGSPLERLLRRKLRGVSPASDESIDPLVVTINSRVEFEVDGEAPETRILVRRGFRNGVVGLTLPITTLRGMALLGLRAGQSFAFEEGSATRTITVRRVLYQPQAARLRPGSGATAHDRQAEIVSLERIREDRARCRRDLKSADRRRGT